VTLAPSKSFSDLATHTLPLCSSFSLHSTSQPLPKSNAATPNGSNTPDRNRSFISRYLSSNLVRERRPPPSWLRARQGRRSPSPRASLGELRRPGLTARLRPLRSLTD